MLERLRLIGYGECASLSQLLSIVKVSFCIVCNSNTLLVLQTISNYVNGKMKHSETDVL